MSPHELNHLDKNGIVKVGSWVEEGDILVGKITPIPKKVQSPYQKLVYTILEKDFLSLFVIVALTSCIMTNKDKK